MSVLVIPVVVTFAILFIPFLSVAVITISTDFAFLFFIVCVTVGGVLVMVKLHWIMVMECF